jgi:hypothetical protein
VDDDARLQAERHHDPVRYAQLDGTVIAETKAALVKRQED